MRDQSHGIDAPTAQLIVHLSVLVKTRFQFDGYLNKNPYLLWIRQRTDFQLHLVPSHLAYEYGRRTMSLLTITFKGKPGLAVNVGWMLKFFRVICCPT